MTPDSKLSGSIIESLCNISLATPTSVESIGVLMVAHSVIGVVVPMSKLLPNQTMQ